MIWVVTGAMAAMVAALLVLATRGAAGAAEPPPDAAVYRAQLKDIARDAARGVIPAEEAERLRAEVARRLLSAETAPQALARGPVGPVVGAAALAACGALGVYLWLGAPGYPDLPLAGRLASAEALAAARPSQAEAEAAAPAAALPEGADAEFLALMDRLRETLEARPDDLQGHRLLAENEAKLGNFAAARAAQERVLAILGEAATAADRSMLARMMVAAAGGTVTPEAEAVLAQALTADAGDPEALFLSGIAQMQVGRPDLAFRLWRQYLEVTPAEAPWRDEVVAQMPVLAAAAGQDWVAPVAIPGPDADAIARAEAMSAAERQEMAQGMVERLAGRLASEGGTAAEWGQLVVALGVLGQTERATAVLEEARTNFAGRAGDMAILDAAARQAGLP